MVTNEAVSTKIGFKLYLAYNRGVIIKQWCGNVTEKPPKTHDLRVYLLTWVDPYKPK